VKIPLSVDRSLEITECDRSLFMLLKVKKKDIRFEVADDILQSGCVSETYKNYMFRAQEMDRLKKADKKGNNRAIKQLKEINKLVLKGHKLLKKILKQTQRALSRIRVPQTRGGGSLPAPKIAIFAPSPMRPQSVPFSDQNQVKSLESFTGIMRINKTIFKMASKSDKHKKFYFTEYGVVCAKDLPKYTQQLKQNGQTFDPAEISDIESQFNTGTYDCIYCKESLILK
jgi:hypothetical protein